MISTKKPDDVVYLDSDGFVHIIYHGPQNKVSLQKVVDRAMAIMEKLVREDKPVLVLADIRDMGEHTPAARMVGMRARTIMPFWRMSIVTSKSELYNMRISKILTSMSGRKKEIGYFKYEASAKKWLKNASVTTM